MRLDSFGKPRIEVLFSKALPSAFIKQSFNVPSTIAVCTVYPLFYDLVVY